MIGYRLKLARVKAKLIQIELGVRAGIEEETASSRISSYENNIHAPDFNLAKRLAKVLDIPVSYLYTEEEDLAEIVLKYHLYKKLNPESIIILSPK